MTEQLAAKPTARESALALISRALELAEGEPRLAGRRSVLAGVWADPDRDAGAAVEAKVAEGVVLGVALAGVDARLELLARVLLVASQAWAGVSLGAGRPFVATLALELDALVARLEGELDPASAVVRACSRCAGEGIDPEDERETPCRRCRGNRVES